jgi:hypothetical protein
VSTTAQKERADKENAYAYIEMNVTTEIRSTTAALAGARPRAE